MPRPLLAAVLIALAARASAAVPGVPSPPRPGPFPDLAIGIGNDAFGGEIGDNADDFRTNQITVQALLGRRWLAVVDHSILTNKARDLAPAGRSDEFTATIGALAEPFVLPAAHSRIWFAGGIGGRYAGDIGGERAQNAIHGALGYNRLHLPYGPDELDGLAYASVGWRWLGGFPGTSATLPFLERGQFGVQTIASGLATTGDEQQVEVGAALTVLGVDGAGWVGPRYRWNAGSPPTSAAEAVARREQGWWLDYGASAGGWFVAGAINLEDRSTEGMVGWISGRPAGRIAAPRPAALEADLEFSGGFSPGVQFRWQPAWLRGSGPLGERSALLADYRFGSDDTVDWGTDSILSYNQATLGAEIATRRPTPGWHVDAFARGALGYRYEVVRVRGPAPRFRDASAGTGVALAGAGVRMTWGTALGPERTARYGIAAFVDGWLPFTRAQARSGADHDQYLRPGVAPGAALVAVIAW